MKNIFKKKLLHLFNLLGYQVIKNSSYEKNSHIKKKKRILKKFITNDKPIIFDVGAHHGESIIEFKTLFPLSNIHSFEPDPDTFKILQENTSKYDCVILNNLGFSSQENEGTQDFYKQTHSKLNSLEKINVKGNTISKWLSGKKEIEVKKLKKQYNRKIKVDISTIEKYCKKNKIESIDLLKLDTQTHERECLLGAKSLLDKVKVIYTEINFFDMYEVNYNFFDLEAIIVPKGFNLYSISRFSDEKKSDKIGWVEAVYLNRKYF
jgi:FkbM family methyltransferase